MSGSEHFWVVSEPGHFFHCEPAQAAKFMLRGGLPLVAVITVNDRMAALHVAKVGGRFSRGHAALVIRMDHNDLGLRSRRLDPAVGIMVDREVWKEKRLKAKVALCRRSRDGLPENADHD